MGRKRKTDLDLLRDEFWRKEQARRAALRGPFTCPKCLADKALYIQEKAVINIDHERGEVLRESTYTARCDKCGFTDTLTKSLSSQSTITDLVDIYCEFFDRHSSGLQLPTFHKYDETEPLKIQSDMKVKL